MRVRLLLVFLFLFVTGLGAAGCTVEFGGGAAGEFRPATPGVLTVATESVPTAGFWLGTRSEPTGGFEYGLARALADRFGLDRVSIRTVPFARMLSGDLGGADIALRELTPTPEREQRLQFSIPYLSAPPAALVRSGVEIPDMKTARGMTWAVPEGTTLVDTLATLIRPERSLVGRNRTATRRLVRSGQADAALFDLPVALALAQESQGRLDVAAQFEGSEALAAALPRNSGNVEAVNSALRALTNDGTISDLARRWLGVTLQAGSFTVPEIPLVPS